MIASRRLGASGPAVGALGLGCMGMSWAYAESSRDDAESIATIHRALDLGVSLIDTADVYGGIEAIDLYYLHRVDDAVPLEQTWAAMAELVEQGLVRRIGLSEVSVEQAAQAHAIHPVAAVQSELSLWSRDPLTDDGGGTSLVAWCEQVGASFVPFAPLGRGFLTAEIDTDTTFEANDFRARLPRFAPQARTANQAIVEVIREIAAAHKCLPSQVALAWVLALGEHVRCRSAAVSCTSTAAALSALLARLSPPQSGPLQDGDRRASRA